MACACAKAVHDVVCWGVTARRTWVSRASEASMSAMLREVRVTVFLSFPFLRCRYLTAQHNRPATLLAPALISCCIAAADGVPRSTCTHWGPGRCCRQGRGHHCVPWYHLLPNRTLVRHYAGPAPCTYCVSARAACSMLANLKIFCNFCLKFSHQRCVNSGCDYSVELKNP